ncbi:hypothetical protein CAL12_17025 [Bordetella genomosp. 8]|uniref:HTH araC/xylS-type domain-containing protein n=1 Tax=Bordetella genomosp. 8 TaxID=1416806 RepID=A0A1W6YMQ3_9BORD|nr:AraC family transcriptional regulator [Bordetella genomosp. 8]ARP82352.1 hypothetical protein CAL12_17025 [Bordetella genomosp. 8]
MVNGRSSPRYFNDIPDESVPPQRRRLPHFSWMTESVSLQSDWLSRLLGILAIRGFFGARTSYRNHWQIGFDLAIPGEIPFYIILNGYAALEYPNAELRSLYSGDIALFPHGTPHRLYDRSQVHDRASTRRRTRRVPSPEASTDEPSHTEIICGRLNIAHPHGAFVRKYLPESLIVRSSDAMSATTSQLRSLVKIIHEESRTNEEGPPYNLDVLAPALFVMLFRALSEVEEPPTGLIAVAGCKQLVPALEGIFAEPSESWTLSDLAAHCGVSRATLLRRFQHKLGCSPMGLLLDIRMALAANDFGKARVSTDEIARNVGYKSSTAFSRAFTKYFGITLRNWKHSQR